MNTLYIGYINGNLHHCYIKDIHGECHGINATTATCLARELIASGHKLVTAELSESNSLDSIDF